MVNTLRQRSMSYDEEILEGLIPLLKGGEKMVELMTVSLSEFKKIEKGMYYMGAKPNVVLDGELNIIFYINCKAVAVTVVDVKRERVEIMAAKYMIHRMLSFIGVEIIGEN